MEQVLTHFGLMEGLTRTEGVLSGDCPLCHQQGFRADCAKNTFRCQNCGKRGSVLDFTAALKGVELRDVATLLKDLMGEGTPPHPQESAEASGDAPATDPVMQEAHTLITALQGKMGEVNQLVERLVALVGTAR